MNKEILKELYLKNKFSSFEIARKLNCSVNKVNYWIGIYKIPKRTISDAIYQKNNPAGDPFKFKLSNDINKMFLFGLGLGLYWGEGCKKNLYSVRLSNTDKVLIKKFIHFLIEIYRIDKSRLRFQLQTYDDLNIDKLITFWTKYLSVKKEQFYKTTLLKKRGEGTYRDKMKHGVIIIYFNNIKLRNLICSQIANIDNL